MALKFPTPPTPPTPPVVEKGDGASSNAKIDAPNFFHVPFVSDGGVNFQNPAEETFDAGEEDFSEEVEETSPPPQDSAAGTRRVTNPETMARDAVANGAGALTKRTVTNPSEENNSPPASQNQSQSVVQIPADTGMSLDDAERGKAVLREFQEEDRRLAESTADNVQTSSETPSLFQPNPNQSQGQGGLYWIVILVVAVVFGFIFVKKFLLTDKPKLKTSDLFNGSSKRLQAAAEKVSKSVKPPPPIKPTYSPPVKPAKPVRLPKKEDEDKGKHFEVRV